MRISLVLDSLNELLAIASKSRQDALLCLGSAEFLLNFLQMAAEASKIGNISGVKERIRFIRVYFHLEAGLILQDDAPPNPLDNAKQALSTLPGQSLLGQKRELMQNNITEDGTILHS